MKRAQAEMWMEWVTTTLVPNKLQTVFWQLIRTAEDKRDKEAVGVAVKQLAQLWTFLDDHLAHRQFVAGDQLTIGDIPRRLRFLPLRQHAGRTTEPAQP